MIMWLYLITYLASVAVLCLVLFKHERIASPVIFFSILVAANSCGRYLLVVSTTLEMALLANVFVYAGACFCPLMIILTLSNLCHIRFRRWVTWGLAVWASLVFTLSMTVGHLPIYYKSVSLVMGPPYSYLEKVYGPTHFLYPALIIVYLVLIVFCLVQAIRSWRYISLRTVGPICALAMAAIVLYVAERLMHFRISYLSICYLTSILIFMRITKRIDMYDLPTNIANSIGKNQENGYIEFDLEYRCVGYNDLVRELFPEVTGKWCIDKKIPEDDSFLYREVVSWVYTHKRGERKTIPVRGRYYELQVRDIPYLHQDCVGYMVALIDRTAENKYTRAIENYNTNLEEDVRKKTEHISHIKDMMVVGMASMVESRDNSTGGHIKRTSQVMDVFSRHLLKYQDELGISEDFLTMVTRAAPMHDLGKIAVDDAILRKQGKYTPEEFDKMKKHPAEGARIVRGILTGIEGPEFVELAVNVAHYHHEKWDGSGYPNGLKGESIPLEARLMALADVFDALVSKRCYKEEFSYDESCAIMKESLGSHFDPVLGRYFLECRPQLETLYDQWKLEEAAPFPKIG